ncbi:MAG: M20 family metallopeptidase [Coprobacillaceae bacterium]
MDIIGDLKKWRQDLHQIPEIGLQEYKTTDYIKEQLTIMGYKTIDVLETGTLVYIDNECKDTIAFRSDIDALQIQEKTECSFASKHQGYMHACGHDGHMSALLGFAKVLMNSKETFSYNFLLIFQPAEESPGGARLLVEEGIMDKYHVKAVFGMHLMPSIEEGVIASKAGPLMAQNGELDVKIKGRSAHAGLYHLGIDSVVIAAQIISEYQSIISRIISPTQSCVLHVGEIHGGSARNIVADYAEFHGTVRTYDEDVFMRINKAIGGIHESMENIYGCDITWSCPPMYPPVINDKKLYRKFIDCINSTYLELEEPLMLAEDFSYYQKEVPGIFFYLGTKTNQYHSGLHTETFNFNEEVLEKAVNTYYNIAKNITLGGE